MSDSEEAVPTQVADFDQVGGQICRSLSSLWERRDGVKPIRVDATLDGNVVRCVIEPGPTDGATSTAEGGDAVGAIGPSAYRNDAINVVARLTRRPVTALIAKTAAKTGISTNTFILERRRPRN